MARTYYILMRRCQLWTRLRNCLIWNIMWLHSDILWIWANQSLLLFLSDACLAEKQQIPFYSLWVEPVIYHTSMLTITQPMRFIQLEVTTWSICTDIVPEQMHFASLNSIYWCITFCLSCSIRKYVQTAMHWNLPSKDNFPFLYTKILKNDTQFSNSNMVLNQSIFWGMKVLRFTGLWIVT